MQPTGLEIHDTDAEDANAADRPPRRFFARQPILDRQENVFGYEFLYRSGTQNQCLLASQAESDRATRLMVDNSLLYGFESLAGRGKAFVNCTREALTKGFVTLLPARSTVLEILEDIEPDDEVIDSCRRLRGIGYLLSLDDYIPRPGMERLVPYVDYIKIDFRLCDASQRAETLRGLKGSKARLIAEKVEDQEEFRAAIAEGFDLFQGYFFCRPAMISRRSLPSNRIHYLRLLLAVSQSPFDWRLIETLVRKEASLCYRLLRLVNAGDYMARNEISSIQRALVTVGEERFRKLITVAITAESGKDRPSELMVLTLQRAAFCEMAATHLQQDPNEQYLFGLLSLLPVLLSLTMQQVVDELPLREPVKAALLGEPNDIGCALRCLQRYESGDLECRGCKAGCSLDPDRINLIYHDSLCWAEKCISPESS